MKVLLTTLLCLFSLVIHAQRDEADKQIARIDSFRNPQAMVFNSKEDLSVFSDSVTEVLEFLVFLKRTENDHLGKAAIEKSRTKTCEAERTYYINEKAWLFAIVDSVRCGSRQRKLTYYFEGGRLAQVVDEKDKDVTAEIDQDYLHYWIRRVFGDIMIIN